LTRSTTGREAVRGARRTRRAPRDTLIAFVMLAPALVLLAIFVIWPMVQSAYLSFFDWSFYRESVFVGFDNFRRVLTDDAFVASVGRGLLFALMVVPTQLVLAFAFASLVAGVSRRLASVLKVSVFIPTAISTVIASIIFILIYQYRGGIANWAIGFLGIEAQAWLADVGLALPAMAVPAIWLGLGVAALIMLAGLLDIPASYYEAAVLDGAGWWQRTFAITLPLMKNTFVYLTIAGFVANVQQFELPLVLTKGGPQDATMLPNLLIFSHFRDDPTVGYSIAAAFLLFIVLGTISALIFRFLNSTQSED